MGGTLIYDIHLWTWWNDVHEFVNVGLALKKGGNRFRNLISGADVLAMG